MFCYVWHLMLYSSNYHCSNSINIFWHQSSSCTQWLIIVTITISSRTQMFNTKAHTIQTTEQHKCSTPKHPLYTFVSVSAEHLIHCDHSILCIWQSPPHFFPLHCFIFLLRIPVLNVYLMITCEWFEYFACKSFDCNTISIIPEQELMFAENANLLLCLNTMPWRHMGTGSKTPHIVLGWFKHGCNKKLLPLSIITHPIAHFTLLR